MSAKVRVEAWDVETRLAQIGFSKQELIDIVTQVVGQYAQVVTQ